MLKTKNLKSKKKPWIILKMVKWEVIRMIRVEKGAVIRVKLVKVSR